MTNKKRKSLLTTVLGLSFLFSVGGLVGCKKDGDKTVELKPVGDVYDYNFDEPFAADDKIDEGMTIDGKLDEAVWSTTNYITHGQEGISFKVGTYFTDNGLYIAAQSTDNNIVWHQPYNFDKNTGFQFSIVGSDKENDPKGGQLNKNWYHPTEKMMFNIDTQNLRSIHGVPVCGRATTEGNTMSVEMFMTWEDLHFDGRQETIRIQPEYLMARGSTGDSNSWISPSGINPNGRFYAMYLFDTDGSISQAGTAKNTSDMTLGNSPLGIGATDRWDLSKDNSEETVRKASVDTEKTEVIWLKDKQAKNFTAETTLEYTRAPSWSGALKNAGLILSDSMMNRRIVHTTDELTGIGLGNTIDPFYLDGKEEVYNGASPSSTKMTLRVVRYNSALYYFYKYEGESDFKFAYVENYAQFDGGNISVGLYATCPVEFSNWNFVSYDENVESLRAELSQHVHLVNTEYEQAYGSVELSASAVAKGGTLKLSVSPAKGYYIEKIEIGGVDKTEDFFTNAVQSTYEFTPTANTTVKVAFAAYSAAQLGEMQSSYIYVQDKNGKKFTGATVSIYPVKKTADGYEDNGAYTNQYYVDTVTTNKGIAIVNLPYEGSSLYPDGTYLVKVTSNDYFHYEKVITIKDEEATNYEVTVEAPVGLTVVNDNHDVVWSVDDTGTIEIASSKMGDKKSIAYYEKELDYGEVSATFTSQSANVMFGFGYRITDSDSNQKGKIGLVGVRFNGSKLFAAAYNYHSSYTSLEDAALLVSLEELIGSGQVTKTGEEITFNLRLVKAHAGMYLFVGNTHVFTFKYTEHVTLSAGTKINFGLMVRTRGALSTPSIFKVKNFTEPTNLVQNAATVSGTITNPDVGSLAVTVTGQNAYGVRTTQTVNVNVASDGTYKFTLSDVPTSSTTYAVSYKQGMSALNNASLTIKSGEEKTGNTITFTQFAKHYTQELYLQGMTSPIRITATEFIGTAVALPNVYYKDNVLYTLDKSLAGTFTGVVPESGTLVLSGNYKISKEFSERKNIKVSEKEGEAVYTASSGAYKYLLSKEAGNKFEISATITNTSDNDSGLGFVVKQGEHTFLFYWGSWVIGGEKIFGRLDGVWVKGHPEIWTTSTMPAYLAKNVPVNVKMSYENGVFHFFMENNGSMTEYASFTIEQCNAAGANFVASEPFTVGIGGCPDGNSLGEFTNLKWNIENEDYIEYTTTLYKPDGTVWKEETLIGRVGDVVSIDGVAYVDESTGGVYVPDENAVGVLHSGTIAAGSNLHLVAKLEKLAYTYGVISSDMRFKSSADGNLIIDTTGGTWYRHVYSDKKSTDFTITAKFTSKTINCETGFSVMNEKGNMLTFSLVAWNGCIVIDYGYDGDRRTYWDEKNYGGAETIFFGDGFEDAKLTNGESITLTLTYKNGEFIITDGVKTKCAYRHEEFTGALHVGFRTWRDNKSGAEVELLDFRMNTSEATPQSVDYLFIGDSWMDTFYWKNFSVDYAGKSAYNLGYGGSEVSFWNNKISDLKRIVTPKHIVMHIGINDIINAKKSANTIATSIQSLMQALKTAYPNAKIHWVSISPTNTTHNGVTPSGLWATSKQINTSMQSYIQSNASQGYDYVDFASVLCQAAGQTYATTTAGADFAGLYNSDGLHLNAATYGLFRDTINSAIGITAKYTEKIYVCGTDGVYGSAIDNVKTGYTQGTVSLSSVVDLNSKLYVLDESQANTVSGTVLEDGSLVLVGYYKQKFAYGASTSGIRYGTSASGNLTLDTTGSTKRSWLYTEQSTTEFTISAKFTAPTTGYDKGRTGFSVLDADGNKLTFMLTSWNNGIVLETVNAEGNGTIAYWDDGQNLGVADATHTNFWDRKFEAGDETTMTLTYKNGAFTLSYYQVNGNKTLITKKALTFNATAGTFSCVKGDGTHTTAAMATGMKFNGALQVGIATMSEKGYTTGMQVELLSLSMGSN